MRHRLCIGCEHEYYQDRLDRHLCAHRKNCQSNPSK